MARPSDTDSEGPPHRRAAASSDAAAAAAGTAERRVSYIVAPAAALPGRWGLLDVLRLVWRYVRGRVLRLIRRNSGDFGTEDEGAGEEPPDASEEPRDAGVVVDKNVGGSSGGKKVADEEPRDAGVVVAKNVSDSSGGKKKNKNKNQNNPPGAPGKKNHAYLYQDRRPRPIPFLMVGNCRVYKEQKDLYAVYCQERPSSGSKQLCHMCILEKDYTKINNTILPKEMLKHCLEEHKVAGIKCTESGCGVRVHTEQERLLHIHFCHRLPAGWWDWDEYKKLDK